MIRLPTVQVDFFCGRRRFRLGCIDSVRRRRRFSATTSTTISGKKINVDKEGVAINLPLPEGFAHQRWHTQLSKLYQVARHVVIDPKTQKPCEPVDERPPLYDYDDNGGVDWKDVSWSQYLLWRGFLQEESFHAASSQEQEAAMVFLSSFLTFPLTLAYYLDRLQIFAEGAGLPSSSIKVCVVGAEGELDSEGRLWNELVPGQAIDDRIIKATNNPPLPMHPRLITVDFIGTTIEDRASFPPKSWSGQHGLLELTATRGSVEDVLGVHQDADEYDLFVAFQPGPGTNASYTWEEGFDMIRDTGKPLLLTAHDEGDADRDAFWWQHTFGETLPPYEPNPCASHVCKVASTSRLMEGMPAMNRVATLVNAR